MITAYYLPTWCERLLENGCKVTALVFMLEPRHPLYEADSCRRTIAPLIAQTTGPLPQRTISVRTGAGAGVNVVCRKHR